MADAIGSVRATFTASASGLLGAIGQSVSGFGNFAASAKRTAASQSEFAAKMATLAAGLANGTTSVDSFGTSYGRLQTRFKTTVSEADRIKSGLEALRGSQAAAGMSAEQLAEAEGHVVAAAKAATPALERLRSGLAENRADFLSGKVSAEQYRNAIATLPGAINGTETDQQKFNRVLQESRAIMAGSEPATAKYEAQLRSLDAALEMGIVDDENYAASVEHVRAAMAAADPAAQALAAAMERGKSVTQANLTEQEKYDQELASLKTMLEQGAISQETFTRATQAADPAVKALAAAMERGKAVTQSNLTATERYDQELAELKTMLSQGAISQETFARASKKAEDALAGTVPQAQTLGQAFGGMPGPIGAAARALDTFGGGMKKMMAGFSGGFGAGLKTMFSDIAGGLSNAFASGGSSLMAIAPQLMVIGAIITAVVVGATKLAAALGATGAEVERNSQLATQMGVSYQELEVIKLAAENAGMGIEDLAKATRKFSVATDAARNGAKEQAEAFAQLGISQEELQSSSPEQLIEKAANALNGMEDSAHRNALALKLFGKGGADAIAGLAGLDEARAQIDLLGGTMSDMDVSSFQRLDDAFDATAAASSRLGKTLLAPFTDLFAGIAEGVAIAIGAFADMSAEIGPLLKSLGGIFGVAFRVAGMVIANMIRGISAILQVVVTPVAQFLEYLFKKAEAVAKFFGMSFSVPAQTGGQDTKAIEEQLEKQKQLKDAEAERQKQAIDRAKSIKEGLLSPYEKMTAQVHELYELERQGLLTAEQRAEAANKITDAYVAQTPAGMALKKIQEDQKKASEDITAEIKKSAGAGKELGAAALLAKVEFATAAQEIKDKLDKGLIDPDAARAQMAEAADAMNEELKRVGDDMKFAEKIRDSLKTEGAKIAEELKAIDDNGTLTDDEKKKAKEQVRKKAADSLPGGGEKSPADKFREDRAKLQDALNNGVIDPAQFKERVGTLRTELESSVDDIAEKTEKNNAPDRRANQAVSVNSSEGASTFFRLLRGQDDPTKKQLAEMKKQSRLLESVVTVLSEEEVVKI